MMKFKHVLFFACSVMVAGFFPAPAEANGCNAGARQLVAGKPDHTLLSVQAVTSGNGRVVCIARIRIESSGGQPPRIVERQFNP